MFKVTHLADAFLNFVFVDLFAVFVTGKYSL